MALNINNYLDSNSNLPVSKKLMTDIVGALGVDFVVEDTTSGIWRIRKWDSGYCELEANTTNYTLDITTAWGGMYYVDINPIAFPITLAGTPRVWVDIARGNPCIVITGSTQVTTSATPSFRVMRPASTSGAMLALNILVIARWK